MLDSKSQQQDSTTDYGACAHLRRSILVSDVDDGRADKVFRLAVRFKKKKSNTALFPLEGALVINSQSHESLGNNPH